MSCRFVTPCLDIARTYSEPPEVYDGLSFYVPQIKPLYQGSVQIADAIYEVWSPNSTTIDYYPGAPLAGPLHAQLRKPCYHDGRLGPHDWTLHPQHYYEKYPWFGFCRNPQNDILEWTSVSPELVPLPVVWVHSMTARGKGFINPHYLSAFKSRAHELRSMVESWKFPVFMTDRLHQLRQDRPRYPNGRDIGVLLRDSLWEWEELVIVFTSIQRGLREMEAWLTMMSHWGFRSIPSPVSIPPVSSGRVGIWLNGASEGDGLWLLGIGIIPVYVIHRFAEDIESPPSSSDSSVPDWRSSVPNHRKGFVHGTRAEQLNSSQGNPYLRFLRRRDLSNVIPFTPHQLHSSVQVNCDERYRSRSASWGFHRRQLEQSDTDHSEPERRASTLNSAQQKSRGKSGSGTDSPVFTVSSCLVRQPHGNMGSASGVHDCSLAPSTDSAKLTISVYAPPRQPCQDDSISLPRELDPEHGKAVDRSVEDNCPPLQEQNSRSAPPQNLCYEGQSVWAKRISACHVEEPFKVADIVPTYSDTTYSHSKDFLFLRCRAPVENDEEVLDWGEDDIELPDDSQPAPPQIPPYDSQSASVESLSMAVDAAPTNPAITQKNSGIEFLGNQHVAQQNASRPFISDHILDDPIDGGAAVEDDSRSAVFPALAQEKVVPAGIAVPAFSQPLAIIGSVDRMSSHRAGIVDCDSRQLCDIWSAGPWDREAPRSVLGAVPEARAVVPIPPPYLSIPADPSMTASSSVYVLCGISECSELKEFILAVCEAHRCRAGLSSILRDPSPHSTSPYYGFMLTFESVDQAALVRRLLSGVPECDIVEPQAADIALAVVDRWGHNTPLDNSDLWKIPTNFPSDTSLLPSNRSLPLSTPKKLLDRLSPYPVSGGPSLNGLAAALPDQSAGDCARPKNRRKRGSEKKKSGGHQQALRNRFGMKFWDLLKVITGEQITSCTPAQQQYILEKKSERVIRPRPFVI